MIQEDSLNDRKSSGICENCGNEYSKLYGHYAKSDCPNPTKIEAESFALFSGGHDSLVSTHYAMENNDVDAVLHIDTNTGIPENEEFVKEICRENDWDLYIRSAGMTLKEFALQWGFPKESSHSWAYRWFKERVLSSIKVDCGSSKPTFYSGVRKDESQRRMANVTSKKEDAGQWYWERPISDWTKEDCEEYRKKNDLPSNPVVENIHRSGECYCGAFANRDEELIELQVNYPKHYEYIMEVEEEIQEERGKKEDHCWWGSSGVSSEELQCLIEESDHDVDMVLCQDCVREADTVMDY